jgi:hypothetical protein
LTCIDPWKDGDVRYKRFIFNLTKAGLGGKVAVHRISSRDLLPKKDVYDLVLIDGDHTAPMVFLDLALVWPLLKTGGVCIMDDYGNSKIPGVGLAADGFLKCFAGKVRVLSMGYQLIFKKLV